MRRNLRSPIVPALFLALMPAVGTNPAFYQPHINAFRRKKGGGVARSRPIRNNKMDETHLYGNKLARKAFRKTPTIKCARL